MASIREPEEFVGELWHRLIGDAASPSRTARTRTGSNHSSEPLGTPAASGPKRIPGCPSGCTARAAMSHGVAASLPITKA